MNSINKYFWIWVLLTGTSWEVETCCHHILPDFHWDPSNVMVQEAQISFPLALQPGWEVFSNLYSWKEYFRKPSVILVHLILLLATSTYSCIRLLVKHACWCRYVAGINEYNRQTCFQLSGWRWTNSIEYILVICPGPPFHTYFIVTIFTHNHCCLSPLKVKRKVKVLAAQSCLTLWSHEL